MTKTTIVTQADSERQWHHIDVSQETLGRVATKIAKLLIGKHKPTYTPHLDNGDYVVVTNAAKINVSGNKVDDKVYRHHTGYPGGFREFTFKQVKAKDARTIVKKAVSGMLPKNKLRAQRLKRLKIFIDDSHPYQNQVAK